MMILEAFFSTVASSVITELFKRAIGKKSLNEKDIERIVEIAIQKQQLVGQASVVEREIIMVLGNAGFVGSGGQLLLPAFHGLPRPSELIGAWWDTRIYKIVSVCSEKVLDVLNYRTDDASSIVQFDYLGGANQQWRLIPVGDNGNLFKIHSQHSGKVLDVLDFRTDNASPIVQFHYLGGTNQQWRLIPIDTTGEIFKIISEHSGKALDVLGYNTDDASPIVQYDYHGGTNQQWKLIRVK